MKGTLSRPRIPNKIRNSRTARPSGVLPPIFPSRLARMRDMPGDAPSLSKTRVGQAEAGFPAYVFINPFVCMGTLAGGDVSSLKS